MWQNACGDHHIRISWRCTEGINRRGLFMKQFQIRFLHPESCLKLSWGSSLSIFQHRLPLVWKADMAITDVRFEIFYQLNQRSDKVPVPTFMIWIH